MLSRLLGWSTTQSSNFDDFDENSSLGSRKMGTIDIIRQLKALIGDAREGSNPRVAILSLSLEACSCFSIVPAKCCRDLPLGVALGNLIAKWHLHFVGREQLSQFGCIMPALEPQSMNEFRDMLIMSESSFEPVHVPSDTTIHERWSLIR